MTTSFRIGILLATLLISVLSYRYVERPFRQRPFRRGARPTLVFAAGAMAAMALLALGVPVAAARLRPATEMADAALAYSDYTIDINNGTCFLSSGFDDVSLFRKDLCLKVADNRRNFLIMGDSHAAHFVPAFKGLHPELNVMQATASGCAAVRGGAGPKRCTQLFAFVFNDFLPKHRVDTVVLAGRWPRWSYPALESTIRYLQPLVDRVVILGPPVEYDQSFPRLLAEGIVAHDAGLAARHLVAKPRSSDRFFAASLAHSTARYFSVYDATCPNDECTQWAAPGVPMQYDEHHLTLQGSELILERLGPGVWH